MRIQIVCGVHGGHGKHVPKLVGWELPLGLELSRTLPSMEASLVHLTVALKLRLVSAYVQVC